MIETHDLCKSYHGHPVVDHLNLIVPEGGKNLIALEMIINRIQRHIDGNAE